MKSTGDRELDRELKERTDFEESNYVRVTLSKAQKKKVKLMQQQLLKKNIQCQSK